MVYGVTRNINVLDEAMPLPIIHKDKAYEYLHLMEDGEKAIPDIDDSLQLGGNC